MRANIKFLFFITLVIFIQLLTSCSKEIFYKKQSYYEKVILSPSINYNSFEKPYFKNRPTPLTKVIKGVILIGTTFYVFTNPNSISLQLQEPILTATATGLAAYTASSLIFKIGGAGGKVTLLKDQSDKIKWVERYNKKHKKKLILVSNSDLNTIKTISADVEFLFTPDSLIDVKNYYEAFPYSEHNNQIVNTVISKFSKDETRKSIEIYSENNSLYDALVKSYITKSEDEVEFKNSLDEYLYAEQYVESEYFNIITTKEFALDFINRYKKSEFINELIEKFYKSFSKEDIDKIISTNELNINYQKSDQLKNRYIELSKNFNEFFISIEKYKDCSFLIKPELFDNTFSKAREIYELLKSINFDSDVKANMEKVSTEIRAQYLRKNSMLLSTNQNEYENFVKEITSSEWLKKDNFSFLKDSIVYNYLKLTTENEYFTGEYLGGKPNGNGEYYSYRGITQIGNFNEGKFEGFGVERSIDGTIKEGEFKDGELNGNGTIKHPFGVVQKGNFKLGSQYGRGVIIKRNGDIIEGFFVGNRLVGLGKRKNVDGCMYEGDFSDDEFSGNGKFIWSEKVYFEGDFSENKRNGKGTLYFNNWSLSGTWSNDCPIEIIATNKELNITVDSPVKINFEECIITSENILIDYPELEEAFYNRINIGDK
jgi:hypothetical protein